MKVQENLPSRAGAAMSYTQNSLIHHCKNRALLV